MRTTPSFLTWHFVVVPREIVVATRNLAIFVFHFFSVPLLLATFFAPWKRQTEEKHGRGFDARETLDILTFNLFSRAIGAVVRCTTILYAVTVALLVLTIGVALSAVNLVIPVVSIPTYLIAHRSQEDQREAQAADRDPIRFTTWFLTTPRAVFLCQRLEQDVGVVREMVRVKMLDSSKAAKSASLSSNQPSGVFLDLATSWKPLRDALDTLRLDPGDIHAVLSWHDRLEQERRNRLKFWDLNRLLRRPSLASDWAYGFTPILDRFGVDLTVTQAKLRGLVGRNKEIERMEMILSRDTEDNVLLIGQEGVGRRTVVLQLAKHISEGRVPPRLKHKRVVELSLSGLVGDSASVVDSEQKVERVLTEAVHAGNIILVIPSIDRFLSDRDGRIDVSPVFDRMLTGHSVQVIGIATQAAYEKYLRPNPTVGKLFGVVEVLPPDREDAIEILERFADSAERERHLVVTFAAVKTAVDVSDRYITDIPFPEKAIDLLDETISATATMKTRVIAAHDVLVVASQMTNIPLGDVTADERVKLATLEALIHQRLIDQEEAVTDLSNTLRRTRLQIGKRQKPAGVFLFLGPTGVGKTETAKVLSKTYFGDEHALTRLDMNEFHDAAATIRLLGDFSSREPGIMTARLRGHPFCVLLLDEIEKASPAVLNLLLTAFDEGYLTDNFGKMINLQNMIIICTSNAGSELIREKIAAGEKSDKFKRTLVETLLREKIFSPEFLNRFDSVIVYKPLTRDQLKAVARLMLADLNDRLKDKDVQITITDALLDDAVRLSFDPTFGARPLRRLIQDRIEAVVAQKILMGQVRRGEAVTIEL